MVSLKQIVELMMNTKSTCSSLKIHPRHHTLYARVIGKGNARGVGERSDASLLSYQKSVVKKVSWGGTLDLVGIIFLSSNGECIPHHERLGCCLNTGVRGDKLDHRGAAAVS